MKIIIGLGNPGNKYQNTRHNAGYMFVDALREFLGWDKYWDVKDWEDDNDLKSWICKISGASDNRVLLVKPMVFMNESGVSAKLVLAKYNIDIKKDLVLVHDDLDIELGRYKIQKQVAPRDHKGVRNVEMMIERTDFMRVRIGVDNREGDRSVPSDEYVIAKMAENEVELLNQSVSDAVKAFRNIADV